jgi:predicted ribosome quality control (RQC) complex YloA/Tae2 family protein
MLFVNCTSNTIVKKPDNLIPKNEMVDILTDMFIANGGEHIKNIHQKRNVNYFPLIFEKYQIDSTQFKESNFYYISKIDDYDEILKKVEARLEKLKEENELTLKNLDSLKKNGELIYENQTKD